MIRVFQCEESLTGILTGVYDAWGSRLGHANVRLIAGIENPQLFCEYEDVSPDVEKAGKVMRTIKNRMGEDAFRMIAQAAAATGTGTGGCDLPNHCAGASPAGWTVHSGDAVPAGDYEAV